MTNLTNYRILGISLLAVSLLVPVYVNSVNAQQVTINGAGATFPFPLIDTWRVEYQNVNPDVSLNYASIGSGGGIKQFLEKTVDFSATDAPLTATEFQQAGNPVHIPETIGSVVLAYNLPEVTTPLNLTGPVISDIFLGKIAKWDDPKIKELNPAVALPSEDIISVHRSDGSGTPPMGSPPLISVGEPPVASPPPCAGPSSSEGSLLGLARRSPALVRLTSPGAVTTTGTPAPSAMSSRPETAASWMACLRSVSPA